MEGKNVNDPTFYQRRTLIQKSHKKKFQTKRNKGQTNAYFTFPYFLKSDFILRKFHFEWLAF